MFKAIIFDMDGTLVNSELLFAQALVTTLEAYHIPLTVDDAVSMCYGRARLGIIEELCATYTERQLQAETLSAEIDVEFTALKSNEEIAIVSSLALFHR
ncbi:MAG: HAD family phosphatase, partial [Planctomycetes bacterium]|nr:HAD family phosphatase [Planctomycetota bacterium]